MKREFAVVVTNTPHLPLRPIRLELEDRRSFIAANEFVAKHWGAVPPTAVLLRVSYRDSLGGTYEYYLRLDSIHSWSDVYRLTRLFETRPFVNSSTKCWFRKPDDVIAGDHVYRIHRSVVDDMVWSSRVQLSNSVRNRISDLANQILIREVSPSFDSRLI